MRRWHHEVSAEWLEHRQQVLTATDVVNLLPEYKRYVKAGEPEDELFPGFAALWCSKHSKGYLDTESQAAAARGHVMEPYAVTAWNKQAKPEFHHWDDCIITKGLCGFSPDATTVEQPKGIVQMSHFFLSDMDEIMEIKSYLPDHHMKCFVEDRMEHREIMQVAMAFKILDQLVTAHIVWYCPGAPVPMFEERYVRDELADEIVLVSKVVQTYEKQAKLCEARVGSANVLDAVYTEDEIWQDHMAEWSDSLLG